MSVNALQEDRKFMPFVKSGLQSTTKSGRLNWKLPYHSTFKRLYMPYRYRRDCTHKRWNMRYRRDSGTLKSIPYSLLQYQLIEQTREKLGNRGVIMYEKEKNGEQ